MSTTAVQGIGGKLQVSASSPVSYSNVAQLKNITFGGMTVEFDEITNLDSGLFKEWMKTLVDAKEVSFEGVLKTTDASQQALLTNIQTAGAAALEYWRVLIFGGSTLDFQGYVADYTPKVEYNKAVTFGGKIKITGGITATWA